MKTLKQAGIDAKKFEFKPAASAQSKYKWDEIFNGEKNVACMPRPNSTASSAGSEPLKKPAVAPSISNTSQILAKRISRDFSPRSANCPAVAENSR